MIVCVKLTKLEAKMLAHAVDLASTDVDEPPMFPGDWARGERAALKRMIAKVRAALPPKEKERNANPS